MKKLVVTIAGAIVLSAAAVMGSVGAVAHPAPTTMSPQLVLGVRQWAGTTDACQGVVVEWDSTQQNPAISSYSCPNPADNTLWNGAARSTDRWVLWHWDAGATKPTFTWGYGR